MELNFNTYSLILLAIGGIAGLISAIIFTRSGSAIRTFSLMMAGSSIWTLGYALELSTSSLEDMLFWIKIEYIGIALIPAFWLIFSFQFTEFDTYLSRKKTLLIFLLPFVTLLMVWTNDWHHFHYKHTSVEQQGAFYLLNIEIGFWYIIHTIVFYAYLFAGILLLIKKYFITNRIFKNQIILIILSVSVPWLANMLYLLDFRPLEHIDVTPSAFVVTGLVISTGLLWFKLFKLLPIAREKIIQDMHEGVLILNDQLQILDVNNAMHQILKEHDHEIIGKPITAILQNQWALEDMMHRQESSYLHWEKVIDDQLHYYEISVTPFLGKQREVSGLFLIFRDVTSNKMNEAELVRAHKQAEAANMAKSDFLAHMSHELRTPLAGIIGFVDLMGGTDLTEEQQQYVSIVDTSAKSLLHIVNEILDLSKIEAGRMALHYEKTDIPELCRQALDLFAWQMSRGNPELKIQISRDIPRHIIADKMKLRQVIINLLGNAVKYTRQGAIILKVENVAPTEEGLSTIRFAVSDTGIGIASENQQKIFNSFTQEDNEITKKYGGTGLGLTISNKLLSLMGSRLQLESKTGEGSIFYFDLQAEHVAENQIVSLEQ